MWPSHRSTTGQAWASVVKNTFYATHKSGDNPAPIVCFGDLLTESDKAWHLAGDFAPAFALLDNRNLCDLVDLSNAADSTTENLFHIHSRELGVIRGIAAQLDQKLEDTSASDLPVTSEQPRRPLSLLARLSVAFALARLSRIRDNRLKVDRAKDMLRRQPITRGVALHAWETIADSFLDRNMLNLGQTLHRRLQRTAHHAGLSRTAAYSAARVTQCLYLNNRLQEAIAIREGSY